MGDFDVKFQEYGKRAVLGKLSDMPIVIGSATRSGGREAAQAIAERARQLAGRIVLKDTGHPQAIQGALAASIRATEVAGRWVVGSDLKYAAAVEMGAQHPGTSKFVWFKKHGRWIKKKGIKPHAIPAQPFLRPAFMWGQKEFFRQIALHTNRELSKLCVSGG